MHTFSLTENVTVFPFCYVFDTVLMWVSFDGGCAAVLSGKEEDSFYREIGFLKSLYRLTVFMGKAKQ